MFEHIDMLSMGIWDQPYTVVPTHLAQIWGLWVTCGVKMLSVRPDWDWQLPQTASLVHIRCVQSVWAHWYAVHGHTVAALNSHTHTSWFFWSHVESKWYHYIMVEADGHLKLLPSSILDIYKCLSKLICCPWAYSSSLTQSYPHNYLAQILGFWVTYVD